MFNNKFNLAILTGIIFLTGIFLVWFFLLSKKGDLKDNKVIPSGEKDEIVIQVGDIFQKINLTSGVVSQPSALDRGDFRDFQGLPDKSDIFYSNLSIIKSDDKNSIILASFIGSEEDADKQREFVCDLSEKKCREVKLFFNEFKIKDMGLMAQTIWWLGWDKKNEAVIGLRTNDVNIGTLYSCNIETKECIQTELEGLIFPIGSLNHSMDRAIAIKQNDILNEKIGERWELLIYDLKNLANPLKNIDISQIINKDDDLVYDGVTSVTWEKDGEEIFIGTTRGIFKLNLESGSVSTIFEDISVGEDDLYWHSDSLKLSDSGRFIVFLDPAIEDDSEDEEEEINESILRVIDLGNNREIKDLFQAKDLTIN